MAATTSEVSNDLQSAVLTAVREGKNDEIERLVVAGAKLDTKDGTGFTLLHWAAAEGQLETLKMLQRKGLDIKAATNAGCTLLHSAAYSGHNDVIEYLIINELDINSKTEIGYTPLHYAAWSGHIEPVQLLVANEANMYIKAQNGWTAQQLAHYHDYKIINDYLVKVSQDKIFKAFSTGSVEAIRYLLSQGIEIPPNSVHIAAFYNQAGMIRYLLSECNMKVHFKNENDETALHVAACYGRKEAVACLLQRGADINSQDGLGRLPLHWALMRKSEQALDQYDGVIKLLLEKKSDAKIKNNHGETALHIAACYGNEEVVRYCLVQGTENINVPDNTGYTALHWAAQNNHNGVIQILLEYKADPAIRNTEGKVYTDLMPASSL